MLANVNNSRREWTGLVFATVVLFGTVLERASNKLQVLGGEWFVVNGLPLYPQGQRCHIICNAYLVSLHEPSSGF